MQDQRQTCFELGSRAYPRIQWSWEDFVGEWDSRGESERTTSANKDDYVRLACLANRPGAWESFDRDYVRPLRGSLLRVCPSREAAEAALQQFRCLLVGPGSKLAAYRPVGSFRAWLRVVAVRSGLEMNRVAQVRSARQDELTERLHVLTAGPEARYAREEMKAVLRSALRTAVSKLPADERHALQLHIVARWNVTQIGRTLRVHRATAARMLVSAKSRLRASLREELLIGAGAAIDDSGEVWADLPSRLDLSLTRLFRALEEHSPSASSHGGRA